jgi:hypothetical protein
VAVDCESMDDRHSAAFVDTGQRNLAPNSSRIFSPSRLNARVSLRADAECWGMADEEGYAVDYLVKRTGERSWAAKILSRGEEVGRVLRSADLTYILTDMGDNRWILEPRVYGEIRPFSLTAKREGAGDEKGDESARTVLTIRDHLFRHQGRFYMFANLPEGRPAREFLIGKRYISRLDTFPFAGLLEIDSETHGKLRRFRGVVVGELSGLGTEGHRVRLFAELEDVALPLSASSYILYSTA